MPELNSITPYIPLTPQTDPNKFPPKDFQPYPRMMTKTDPVTKKVVPFYTTSGAPVVVHDEDEEAAFRAENADVREANMRPEDLQDELAKLRARNAELEAAARGDQTEPVPAKAAPTVAGLVSAAKAKPEVTGDKGGKNADRRAPSRLDD